MWLSIVALESFFCNHLYIPKPSLSYKVDMIIAFLLNLTLFVLLLRKDQTMINSSYQGKLWAESKDDKIMSLWFL